MFTFFIIIHIIICLILIAVVLLQPAQGQGLSETLGGGMAETILGSRAAGFLVKLTTIIAVIFFIISISVTILSLRRTETLIIDEPVESTSSQKTQED
jgi:preprotein translocase subunit SecG